MIEKIDKEKIMCQWDFWRKRIAEGDKSSAPRDWFESIIDYISELESESDKNKLCQISD